MKQLTAIFDIGNIREAFISISWNNCQTLAFWNLKQVEDMFYTWLVINLEAMYYIVPDQQTLYRVNRGYLRQLDYRYHLLNEHLYRCVKVPVFTGDYRCHVKLLNDDLFLIFN